MGGRIGHEESGAHNYATPGREGGWAGNFSWELLRKEKGGLEKLVDFSATFLFRPPHPFFAVWEGGERTCLPLFPFSDPSTRGRKGERAESPRGQVVHRPLPPSLSNSLNRQPNGAASKRRERVGLLVKLSGIFYSHSSELREAIISRFIVTAPIPNWHILANFTRGKVTSGEI